MKISAKKRNILALLIILMSTAIFSFLASCVYEEFHGQMLSQSYVQQAETWERKKLPIDKLLFEGLKANDLGVLAVLCPTLDEYFQQGRIGNSRLQMREIEEFRAKRIKIMTGQFKEVRHASEDRGLVWSDASLVKTTGQNEGLMRLNISDGKNSIVLFARIGPYRSSGGGNVIKLTRTDKWPVLDPLGLGPGEIKISTMRMTDGPVLYPFAEGDADILNSWDYTKASEEETRTVRNLYVNRKVHKDYISFWRGVPDAWNPFGLEFDTGKNKWVYKDRPPFILEFYFSSDGYVTDVKVTKEEKK